MRVLITGTSKGIGKAIAELFLSRGSEVIGFDMLGPSIDAPNYTHFILDVRDINKYPELPPIDILVNNAGTQNVDDININLKALIDITEHYGIHSGIKSILNIGSASAHTGSEFPYYAASKGGVLSYTKNVAIRIAQYGATCNSLDPGGVLTELNNCVINNSELWKEIMDLTPLKRWATPEEIAEWVYFLTVTNKFCTAQNILVDGGEAASFNFVWER